MFKTHLKMSVVPVEISFVVFPQRPFSDVISSLAMSILFVVFSV